MANIKQKTKYDGYEFIDCSRCGKYYLKKFLPQLMNEDISNFYKVSSWITEENDFEDVEPKINEKKFEEILNQRDKKIKEKFDLMMNFLHGCSEKLINMKFCILKMI